MFSFSGLTCIVSCVSTYSEDDSKDTRTTVLRRSLFSAVWPPNSYQLVGICGLR
ncbi:hypothetical protein PF008_g2404 [Phytophthora fragariae]|uniref:Uncharacterized protein n=1 Tax=Phytophthora fragariae TaxID=53985 RepID=A0A6G0SJ55_9STRA|nr:hypothetical protein PF008_g2404 [Phytophthora fragariae]